jgi:hypothetical protein
MTFTEEGCWLRISSEFVCENFYDNNNEDNGSSECSLTIMMMNTGEADKKHVPSQMHTGSSDVA